MLDLDYRIEKAPRRNNEHEQCTCRVENEKSTTSKYYTAYYIPVQDYVVISFGTAAGTWLCK